MAGCGSRRLFWLAGSLSVSVFLSTVSFNIGGLLFIYIDWMDERAHSLTHSPAGVASSDWSCESFSRDVSYLDLISATPRPLLYSPIYVHIEWTNMSVYLPMYFDVIRVYTSWRINASKNDIPIGQVWTTLARVEAGRLSPAACLYLLLYV